LLLAASRRKDQRKRLKSNGKYTVIHLLQRIWNEDQGVLTFEWVLLATVLVLGIVGGLSAARDAIIDELGDVGGAVIAIDKSWTVPVSPCDPYALDFGSYTDTLAQQQIHRGRPAICP
jgi:Flp pilus assembly pilin Flp